MRHELTALSRAKQVTTTGHSPDQLNRSGSSDGDDLLNSMSRSTTSLLSSSMRDAVAAALLAYNEQNLL